MSNVKLITIIIGQYQWAQKKKKNLNRYLTFSLKYSNIITHK